MGQDLFCVLGGGGRGGVQPVLQARNARILAYEDISKPLNTIYTSESSRRCYINTNIMFVDIIHRPDFISYFNILFYLSQMICAVLDLYTLPSIGTLRLEPQ
jgi:hypothetical protein